VDVDPAAKQNLSRPLPRRQNLGKPRQEPLAATRIGNNLFASAFFSNAPFWPVMPCTVGSERMKVEPIHRVPMRREYNSSFSAAYSIEGGWLV
jgi:hypothetical protein